MVDARLYIVALLAMAARSPLAIQQLCISEIQQASTQDRPSEMHQFARGHGSHEHGVAASRAGQDQL